MSGPAGLIYRGDPAIFALNPDLNFKDLKFHWTVSSGTIVSGQGTPVIEVDSDLNSSVESIIATVEVSGLPEGCKNLASEVAGIKFPGDPVVIEEYGKVSPAIERERLDVVAAE